jgi:hypothetical protein
MNNGDLKIAVLNQIKQFLGIESSPSQDQTSPPHIQEFRTQIEKVV